MAAPPWEADAALTPEDAARRINDQFPALAPVRLELLGAGWDNLAFLVNGRFVFRFPRRRFAAGLIEREVRILSRLAPRLSLPTPVPTFVGRPDSGYPYSFAGYPLVPGVIACRCAWTDAERARCAAPLARFLAALHGTPVENETLVWAPGDDIERANLAKRAPLLRQRLNEIAPEYGGDIAALQSLTDRLAETPPYAAPPRWVHGDLYARHLLIDEEHRLCGVIDWGDAHLGDPALDLSIAFSFLPPEARSAFRAAYGPIDDATWARARFRALTYGAVLIHYGVQVGDAPIRAAGEVALRSAVV